MPESNRHVETSFRQFQEGKICLTCKKELSSRLYFCDYFSKKEKKIKRGWSKVTALCACGCLVVYRDGRHSWVPANEYRRDAKPLREFIGDKNVFKEGTGTKSL